MFEIKNLKYLRSEPSTYVFQITELTNHKDFIEFESQNSESSFDYVSSVIYKRALELHIHTTDYICVEFLTTGVLYDILLSLTAMKSKTPFYVIQRIGEKNVEESDNGEEEMDVLDTSEIHNLCEEEKMILKKRIDEIKAQMMEYEKVMLDSNSISLLKRLTEINMNFNKKLKKNNI
jgi:hypothetical protein